MGKLPHFCRFFFFYFGESESTHFFPLTVDFCKSPKASAVSGLIVISQLDSSCSPAATEIENNLSVVLFVNILHLFS